MIQFAEDSGHNFVFLALTLTACPGGREQVRQSYNPPALAEFLTQNDWIVLPIPDNKAGPANVIQVTQPEPDRTNVRWLGDFRRCGLSDEDLGYVPGKYPSIGTGQELSLDVGTALNLTQVDLGANIKAAKSAILTINESGGDAIDLLVHRGVQKIHPGDAMASPEARKRIVRRQGRANLLSAPVH